MFIQGKGTAFLGCAESAVCENCHNHVQMHLLQEYLTQTFVIFTPKPTYGCVYKVCPICETSLQMLSATFSSAKLDLMYADIAASLEAGKVETKKWFLELNGKDKENILSRMRKLRAFSVADFLEK
jgi:hypothetical protein